MAFKARLTKAEFDALPEGFGAHYKKSGDSYVIDVDGETDGEINLRRAKEHERDEVKRLKAELDETRNAAEASGAEWKTKYDQLVTQTAETRAKSQKTLADTLIASTAGEIASELFGKNAPIGLPHVSRRLTVEFADDGTHTLSVLGADGKPTKVEDLKKEFLTSPEFSPILQATGASGGGGSVGGGSRASTQRVQTEKRFGELSTAERAAEIARRRETKD
ncbi:scaffold protein [Caudoviricetes sp.]|nr:scaffold protein [Caudoviricetes sp.]